MSSDYDDDDDFLLNLGDEDIRKLSEVEDKCGIVFSQSKAQAANASSVNISLNRGENPPPSKRPKVAQFAPATQLSDDDTPDILVNADGSYALDSPGPSVVSLAPSFNRSSGAKHRVPEPAPRSISPAAGPSRAPNHNGGYPTGRPSQRYNSNNLIQIVDTPPVTQGLRPLIRAGSLSQAISRGLSKNGIPANQHQSQLNIDASQRGQDPTQLLNEVAALRKQLAQAQSEREKLRVSLEQNKETSFAKAGEAENLRRTMSKQKDQHAEELARLKQEMTEVENSKLALEHRMKLEMDQLRTAMTFKQHERETSRRGFPNVNASLRKRQTIGGSRTPGSSQALSRTPELQHSPLSPKKKTVKRAMAPPALPEKSFSNLTNSFNRSKSPIKAQVRTHSKSLAEDLFENHERFSQTPTPDHIQDKGKSRAIWQDSFENTISPIQKLQFEEPEHWRSPAPATQEPFAIEPDVFGPSSLPKTPMKAQEGPIPTTEVVHPLDQADELRMLLLAHVILFNPPEDQKTFSLQHVLTASVPAEFRQQFDTACTSLFNAFSGSIVSGDAGDTRWDHTATKASLALSQLAQVFQEVELLDSLYILVNLLTSISINIPSFSQYLLKASVQNNESLLLVTLCNVIVRFFKNQSGSGAAWHLAESIIGLCEALASHAKDDSAVKFAILFRRPEVLSVMLDPAQPTAWTVRVTRMLATLAFHPLLPRTFLSAPEISTPTGRELNKVPLVELLCRHLTSFRKHNVNEHHRELYENVLATLSHLAIADGQSLTTLVESLSLIPSLASFIHNVSSTIWSEFALSESCRGDHGTCLVQNLRSAIQLLHYLTFSSEPQPNIRERLCYAPRGPFNGLIHLFIVAFGRLAFGDPPEYLDESCAKSIREIRMLSETLLETVVDGPEVDGIYVVFHSDEEENLASSGERVEPSVADEEEALHMAIDDY